MNRINVKPQLHNTGTPVLRVFTLYHKKKGIVRNMIVQDSFVKRLSTGKHNYLGLEVNYAIAKLKQIGYTVTELIEHGEQE